MSASVSAPEGQGIRFLGVPHALTPVPPAVPETANFGSASKELLLPEADS